MAIQEATIRDQFEHTLESTDLPGLGAPRHGQVRDIYHFDDFILLIMTDRVRVNGDLVGTVPFKGEVLTQCARWWLSELAEHVPNRIERMVDPQAFLLKHTEVLPVQLRVFGRLAGALAERYATGDRLDGRLPNGLKFGNPLPDPVELVRRRSGDVDDAIFDQARDLAFNLFRRGSAVAEEKGLILASSTYDFGRLPDGTLVTLSTLHAPDRARYWVAEEVEAGASPERIERLNEDVQLAGWGIEAQKQLDEAQRLELAQSYTEIAERLLPAFEHTPGPSRNRLALSLSNVGLLA